MQNEQLSKAYFLAELTPDITLADIFKHKDSNITLEEVQKLADSIELPTNQDLRAIKLELAVINNLLKITPKQKFYHDGRVVVVLDTWRLSVIRDHLKATEEWCEQAKTIFTELRHQKLELGFFAHRKFTYSDELLAAISGASS